MAASPESYPCHDSNESENQTEHVNAEPSQILTSTICVDVQNEVSVNETCSTPMEKSQNNHFPIDEIPEPIKVLDDIISEFEDSTRPAPPVTHVNGENQSEDDGYMSLSRKNMHRKDCEAIMPQANITARVPLGPSNKSFRELDSSFMRNGDCIKEHNKKSAEKCPDPNIIQSTLPKVRPNVAAINTNYSSLPCCGVRSSGSVENKIRGGGSCNGERNVLGIDISAVHNAVLRGGLAKLPEPIVNEHPVTIYPGRYSPPSDGLRAHRPHRLMSSVEKHKEVCHILNPLSSISSSSSSSTPSTGSSENKKKHAIEKSRKDAKMTNKFPSGSEDEFSEDSLSPLSSQLTPNKQTGIAWEIHFESDKKKSKASSGKKASKKNVNVNSASAFFISGSSEPIPSDLEPKSAISIEDFDEDSEHCTHLSAEKLNYCMYRHSNMLGKGTFIIRRSTKQHPKAMDIFSTLDNDSLSESERIEDLSPPPFEASEIFQPSQQILHTNPRHSFELGMSVTSPRDRLSLNIESSHQNSLNRDIATAKSMVGKMSSEEFTKSLERANFKPNETQHSSESINEKAPSLEEELGAEIKVNTNSFERFPYKSNGSNGTKNSEYNELRTSSSTTPHTDLAPTLEEDEEQYSDFSYGCAPLQQIESNISALLRGEIALVRVGVSEVSHAAAKRSLEFRPGVHKSESAKEMLLSQNALGPLPPSPPSSNPDLFDYDALPPLPPTPTELATVVDDDLPKPYMKTTSAEIHAHASSGEELRIRESIPAIRNPTDDLPLPPPSFENLPPAVPPHRGHSVNTMKSWSIDSNYKKKSPKMLGYGSGITTPTTGQPMPPSCDGGGGGGGAYSTKRFVAYGTKRSLKQSPREEHRLQTSCSLPETPIFARGCDIPRTPFRRQNENTVSGSRTAPRSSTSHSINMGTSIVGISGGGTFGTGMCRQRSINHALASNEMLRLSGVPARGWYPKQRSMRPASTENIDRLTSIRVWDSAAGMSSTGHTRKPLTLPPNLTPSFLNKSPREALRRVTSLLITKKKNTKERKNKAYSENTNTIETANITSYEMDTSSSVKDPIRSSNNTAPKPQKKKGLFKNLWKRTKHFSLDQ